MTPAAEREAASKMRPEMLGFWVKDPEARKHYFGDRELGLVPFYGAGAGDCHAVVCLRHSFCTDRRGIGKRRVAGGCRRGQHRREIDPLNPRRERLARAPPLPAAGQRLLRVAEAAR